MTAEAIQAGAASPQVMNWQTIDWQKVHRTVRRLQARIVKATQARRWGKVKALQRLLTHSFSGKALAVRRVTENPGKRTPGVDGVLWDTPTKKATAVHMLRQRGYHPQPLKRVTSQRAGVANSARSAFHVSGIERCRRSTCWHLTPSRKPPVTRTPTGSGKNAPPPMPSSNVFAH